MTLSTMCERGNHGFCWDKECSCGECHFTCDVCGSMAKVLYDSRCANCERDKAKRTLFDGYPCDDCGKKPAFRNPHHRDDIYRCTACHVKAGSGLALPGNVGEMVTSGCAHLPLTDSAHEFLKLRGTRYRCQRCHQDVFCGQGGFTASQINIVGETRVG